MHIMKKLVAIIMVQVVLLRHHRKLKKKNLHHDIVLNHLDGLIKRHSTGQICKLKMDLRQGHKTDMNLDGSLTNDSFDNVKVLGDQCYCKFHEHGTENSCAQLLSDPQVLTSVDVKHEISQELEKRMNSNRKTNSKHKHSQKKRKNKRLMKKRSVFLHAKENRQTMEAKQQADEEMEQIIKERTWWLGLKRYVIQDCESDEEYRAKCLNHCLKLPLQHYDLIDTHHTPTQDITTSDVISQAMNQS